MIQNPKRAGCEKLPDGPMRDNCEKKKEEGAEAKEASDSIIWAVSEEEFEQAVRSFAHKAKASAVTGPGMHVGMHVYWHNLTEAPGGRFSFNIMCLYKHFFSGHASFGIYTAFNNKSQNALLTKEFYGTDVQIQFKKFQKRLDWTVRAIPQMLAKGLLEEKGGGDNDLRAATIKLAHVQPGLRPYLVPALRRAFCGCPKCAAGTTKEEWEAALKTDEALAKRIKADIEKLQRGEKVENLSLEGAKAVLKGVTEVINNKKRLLSKLGCDEIEAGREHGEHGKGYGMSGPDVRGPGKWQPKPKGKCYYETGDEGDRCYVTQHGGPGGQKKPGPSTKPGDWKDYEGQRWE